MRRPVISTTDLVEHSHNDGRFVIRRTFIGSLLLLAVHAGHAQGFSPADVQRCESRARQVQIIRDKWGIPHIYGKTDASAVFGLMYAECEEDFSRMEKNYLEVMGRQAEAYGASYLHNDLQMRLIYDSVQAVRDYKSSPVWMHKLLDAFADGVNYYLYKHPATKPLVLHHWEPWYALMFTDGSVSATSTEDIKADETWEFYNSKELRAAVPPRKVQHVSAAEKMVLEDRGILPPDVPAGKSEPQVEERRPGVEESRPDIGSNGFAIAPSRTADGNTLLYINPHVPFYFRMEVHLVSDEGLNAYGAVTWGQFFIYQGFNAHCGWMHTSSYADVADLYKEKVSRKDQGWVYEYEGRYRDVTGKPFTVWCRKDNELVPYSFTGLYTHHGPIIAAQEGKWLSLKEYNRSLNALLEAWLITKARTFGEYKKAMDLRANTTNNTVYADDQGNIAYWHGNFMPRRDTSYDWSHPVDGTIAATEWKGLHPLDEIVHLYNPATGWIQNCNSTPFSLSGNSSPRRQDYPYYMAPDGENFRALNAVRLLRDAHGLTLDSLIAKGYDTYLTAFDRLLPALFDAYGTAGDQDKASLKEAIDTLKQWNRRSAVHSIAVTLAVEWGMRMMRFAPRPARPEDG
ncbi:MAG TPA: penicillin acylase family protein, partial [Puia sp.]|nr:penicillin acylase family protein [Puia sp.]